MPKLSVIVPVYNQKRELDRCVDHLINQTMKDIEIILVDDGSTDGSSEICDKYAEQFPIVHVVHKANGGLSSARNKGIEFASGEYIAFVDSDDWVDIDTYDYCIELINTYDADIVKINYALVHSENEIIRQKPEKIRCFEGKDILQYYMYDTTKTGSYGVCWYVFPRIKIQGLSFREGKINEDIDFVYKLLNRCNRMVVSNAVKYYYYQKGYSLSTGGLKSKDFDLYEAADELYKLAKSESYGTIKKLAEVKKARTPLSLLCKISLYGIQDSSIQKQPTVQKLQHELRSSLCVLLTSPISISRKGLAILFSINYSFTEKAVQLFKKK